MAQTWNLKSVCVGLVLGTSGALAVGAQQAASPQFTDYVVVTSMSQSVFKREVKAKLKDGYELIGGAGYAFPSPTGSPTFSQAMAKR